jgi:glycopeptide antibiotics resistance protein
VTYIREIKMAEYGQYRSKNGAVKIARGLYNIYIYIIYIYYIVSLPLSPLPALWNVENAGM